MRQDNNSPSRSSRKRKKADRILNWAIGIVAALILVVGGVILVSLLHSPGQKSADTGAPTYNKHSEKTSAEENNSGDVQKSDDGHKDSTNKDESQSNKDKQKKDKANDKAKQDQKDANKKKDDKNSKLNDEAASTANESNHTASYDKGSADWNAQLAAVSSATGISQDNMVVYWLGNGGGPNSSLARVAPKDNAGQKYVVHLTWKQGEGWKADSVKKP
ncbi:YrrS family protein [Scopulibacillus cellulosilyticus]|uniref:YrrS family protein n=1 Tax=Scopulibacillus cellulosilyticus TaxID=2665665 RepID=A0ABW2PYA3_9BACL